MKAFSTDLRQQVVTAYDASEGTQEQLASRFAVSTSWVRKIHRQRREIGSIERKPHGGSHAKAFSDVSDATLEELGRAAGVASSVSAAYQR